MADQVAIEQQTPQAFYRGLVENTFDAVVFVNHNRQVTYWNPGAEQLTGYRLDEIVGKSCCEDILLHFDNEVTHVCSGSFPAAQTLEDGQIRTQDAYIRHKAGHLIPISMRVAPIRDASGRIEGVMEVFTDNSSASQALAAAELVKEAGFIDPVTRLANRRYVEMRLEARFDEMRRYEWNFGVIMATIDNFEDIEEAHGRQTSDELMRLAGRTFANSLRSYDTVGRWEDCEFLAIVPILQYSDLYAIGDRVRRLVDQTYTQAGDRVLGVTVSVGAAAADVEDAVEDVVERAHRWMQASKEGGGNKVSF